MQRSPASGTPRECSTVVGTRTGVALYLENPGPCFRHGRVSGTIRLVSRNNHGPWRRHRFYGWVPTLYGHTGRGGWGGDMERSWHAVGKTSLCGRCVRLTSGHPALVGGGAPESRGYFGGGPGSIHVVPTGAFLHVQFYIFIETVVLFSQNSVNGVFRVSILDSFPLKRWSCIGQGFPAAARGSLQAVRGSNLQAAGGSLQRPWFPAAARGSLQAAGGSLQAAGGSL